MPPAKNCIPMRVPTVDIDGLIFGWATTTGVAETKTPLANPNRMHHTMNAAEDEVMPIQPQSKMAVIATAIKLTRGAPSLLNRKAGRILPNADAALMMTVR